MMMPYFLSCRNSLSCSYPFYGRPFYIIDKCIKFNLFLFFTLLQNIAFSALTCIDTAFIKCYNNVNICKIILGIRIKTRRKKFTPEYRRLPGRRCWYAAKDTVYRHIYEALSSAGGE